MRFYLKAQNAKRETGECKELIRGEALVNGACAESTGPDGRVYNSVEEARLEKGDLWSGFRYSL